MNSSDPDAKNLFARLFTYAPRPTPKEAKQSRRRNALEDFCTEALAWCLIRSQPFAEAFFATLKMHLDLFELDTQLSFTGEVGEKEPDDISRSQFDLVVKSSAPRSLVIVIESKVAFDPPAKIRQQIKDYRRKLKDPPFSNYNEKRIVLLTPFSEKHDADLHLSWNQVYEVIEQVAKAPNESKEAILREFAEFLKMRNLTNVKLPSITPLLPALKDVGPRLVGLESF